MSDARVCAAELGFRADSLICLRSKEDAVTWRCTRGRHSVILKCYRGRYAGLSAAQRCRKSELAAAELSAAGIATPKVLAAAPDTGSVLFEDIIELGWSDSVRTEASATLRRLHELPAALSDELSGLLTATEPNRARIALGVRMFAAELDTSRPGWRRAAPKLADDAETALADGEPSPGEEELCVIHGDYFRVNLLAAAAGVQVIDWDRLGVGDPAWDIAFLLAAETEVGPQAAEAALAAYGSRAPALERRLAWHLRCWQSFWALRALLPRQRE